MLAAIPHALPAGRDLPDCRPLGGRRALCGTDASANSGRRWGGCCVLRRHPAPVDVASCDATGAAPPTVRSPVVTAPERLLRIERACGGCRASPLRGTAFELLPCAGGQRPNPLRGPGRPAAPPTAPGWARGDAKGSPSPPAARLPPGVGQMRSHVFRGARRPPAGRLRRSRSRAALRAACARMSRATLRCAQRGARCARRERKILT